MARNAAPLSARPRLAVCRPRERNRRSGTSGAAERDSTTKNAAKRATAPASSATTSVDPQPSGSARITPSTSARSPPVPSTAPVASKLRGPSMPARLSRTNSGVTATSAIPIGTLTKNTPLPAERIDEHAAGDHAERAAEARETAPDAHGDVAIAPVGERHGQDRERRGREQRAAEALGRACGDEDARRRREPGHERGAGEQRQAGHEHPATTEQVGRAAAEQQEAAEQQRVRADDPLQARRRRSRGPPGCRAARRSRSSRRARP